MAKFVEMEMKRQREQIAATATRNEMMKLVRYMGAGFHFIQSGVLGDVPELDTAEVRRTMLAKLTVAGVSESLGCSG